MYRICIAIAYVVLVLGLVGWALFHRPRERRAASDRESLLKSLDEDKANSANMQYDENLALKGREVAPQLPIIQGYISSFYMSYGTWVARNPTLVLYSSLAVVIVLCFGRIRFQVKTRPEKLWVGHGSKADIREEEGHMQSRRFVAGTTNYFLILFHVKFVTCNSCYEFSKFYRFW